MPPSETISQQPASAPWMLKGGICLTLLLVTLGIYAPARNFDFINYDDNEYVTDNPHVTTGLTLENIRWAFTHSHSSNWHPLTWISHMLDVALWGMNAGGHHATNVLIHAINAMLLFLLVQSLTGATWRSAFVAALFAWHPLHVESVAWISERKDVLSVFFGFAALIAYRRFAIFSASGNPHFKRWYALALFLFALGLMSKPMLVTLPFVMLLLDHWPLQRITRSNVAGLFREKLPFLALAGASCIATFLVQRASGAVKSLTLFPFSLRTTNAVVSYVRYLTKMFWPENPSIYYPLKALPVWQSTASALLLLLITWMVLKRWRTRPWLGFGWFWYLGTLVPVIGLVQVGDQAMADRYTYLPLVGIFIAITWSAAEWIVSRRNLALPSGIIAVALCAACVAATSQQLSYWREPVVLFARVAEVIPDDPFPHNYLGAALEKKGRTEEAIASLQRAIQLRPQYSFAHNNLGLALSKLGQLEQAVESFQMALRFDPALLGAHVNLAAALDKLGRAAEADQHFAEALRIEPDDASANFNLANALTRRSRFSEAIPRYERAIKSKPSDADIHNNFGVALSHEGQNENAIQHFHEALRLQPDLTGAWLNIAVAFTKLARLDDAITAYEKFISAEPDNVGSLNSLARLYLKHPDASHRNLQRATELARHACDLTKGQDAYSLLTFAAVQIETGDLSGAIKSTESALQLAKAAGRLKLAQEAQSQLDTLRAASAQPSTR